MPRSRHHDYRTRTVYHITMTKSPEAPPFGELTGHGLEASVSLSPLRKIINRQLFRMSEFAPEFRVLQHIVMPDHIHFLLFVTSMLEMPLGKYMAMFKAKIRRYYRGAGGADVSVFERDFYDRILYNDRPMKTVVDYIRSNPYRLAIRRDYPEYFRRVNSIQIGGERFMAYGNVFLLRNPWIDNVVVHRRYTEQELAAERARWEHVAANGGVLVSPFISTAEKEERRNAEALGAKIICIYPEPLPPRFKPSGHDFDLCTQGRLLILAPCERYGPKLSRSTCVALNALAERIAREPFSAP